MSYGSHTVLLVDDSKIMRRIIASFLVKMGIHDVLEAPNARVALDVLDKEKIDLVISDYSMPGLSGLDLLKTVRRDREKDQPLFIMVTAEAQLCQIVAVFKEGAQQYVTKPFTRDYLEYIIRKTLQL